MLWIRMAYLRLSGGFWLLCAVALLATRLNGVESPDSRRGERNPSPEQPAEPAVPATSRQREELRLAQRREHNELDPSIEESPALPAQQTISDEATAKVPRNATPDGDFHAAVIGHTAWPQPTSLLAQLSLLVETNPECAGWSDRVRAELEQLMALPSLDDRSSTEILNRLDSLADESRELARRLESEDGRSRLLRVGFSIVRRLAIWQPAARAAQDRTGSAAPAPAEAFQSQQRLRMLLAAVEAELPQTGDARPWREYLLLDHLHAVLGNRGPSEERLRTVAREALYRLHSTQLADVQARFLERPTFRNLAQELKTAARQAANLSHVLAAVEAYEQQDQAAAAVRLAGLYDELRWSLDPHVEELAESINTYYRNANVRVAVSAELVNRLLPGQQMTSEPIVDQIQGAHVEGASQTNTNIRLVLLPTRGRWEFGIEASGDVSSHTTSSAGPARFHQFGWSNFRARKRLTVDRRGIRIFQAEAEANAETQLNDFETEFDGIPLLSGFARAIARNQYEQKTPAARSEVEGKISYRASSELDKQVAQRLQQAKQNFQQQLVQPLQELQLEPTALDMETTQERLIARYRLAGRDQVSAYTPRPQAPGDSLLSVQIHESALNNVLSHLKLEGRRVDLISLFKEMTDRFSDQQVPVPEDIREDIFVTFADEDPVRIDCRDGHVRLTIRLQALEEGGEVRFRDLTVVARYKPDPDQLDANLVRDGIFELPRTPRTGDRVVLSAIFGKVLNRNRKLNLINERISRSPHLKDQQVTQFVIHDGWIGVALGPKTADRQAQLQQRPQP